MALWRALADIAPGANWPYISAGTVFSDLPGQSVPQMVPTNYLPNAYFEPLDADALTKFYAVGPYLPSGSVPIRVAQATTRWIPNPTPTLPGNGAREYVLTGLGQGLPFLQLNVNSAAMGGVYP
jgi:hypothetical protein